MRSLKLQRILDDTRTDVKVAVFQITWQIWMILDLSKDLTFTDSIRIEPGILYNHVKASRTIRIQSSGPQPGSSGKQARSEAKGVGQVNV